MRITKKEDIRIKDGRLDPEGDPVDWSKEAPLRGVDLARANFGEAKLAGADLRWADLRWTDLRWTNFTGADLRRVKLVGANLTMADLRKADLRKADLQWADLQWAALWWADLRGVDLTDENVAALLLCSWNVLSSDLTTELMRLDAANYPDPSRFDAWAQGGACPYQGLPVKRVAQFQESRKLWSPGPARPAKELLLRIFEEKGVRF